MPNRADLEAISAALGSPAPRPSQPDPPSALPESAFAEIVGEAIALHANTVADRLQSKWRGEIAQRDARIAALEGRLAEKDARTSRLEQRLGDLETRLSEAQEARFRGVWQRPERYQKGNFTTRNGSIWFCAKDCTGVAPGESPEHWVLAAKAGVAGGPTR